MERTFLGWAMAYKDPDEGVCFWVCRFGDTDNYSLDIKDATLFAQPYNGYAMLNTYELNDHTMLQVWRDDDGYHYEGII